MLLALIKKNIYIWIIYKHQLKLTLHFARQFLTTGSASINLFNSFFKCLGLDLANGTGFSFLLVAWNPFEMWVWLSTSIISECCPADKLHVWITRPLGGTPAAPVLAERGVCTWPWPCPIGPCFLRSWVSAMWFSNKNDSGGHEQVQNRNLW